MTDNAAQTAMQGLQVCMSGGPEAPAPVSCRPATGGTITRELLHWRTPAGLTASVRGNPVEHSNIRVIKSSGQARKCATGLRPTTCEPAITAEMLAIVGV